MVFRRDAVGYVVGADLDAGPVIGLDQVIVIVPANAGSSESKSTAWTTRVPAVALSGEPEASA